jgi:hypothetical protein
VENVVSGKYDRVTVSTTFRQQSSSTGNKKQKKEAKDSVLRSEGSWYYSKLLRQQEQVN